MAMDRWNPFRDMIALREAMDRMFEDSSLRSGLASGRASSFPSIWRRRRTALPCAPLCPG